MIATPRRSPLLLGGFIILVAVAGSVLLGGCGGAAVVPAQESATPAQPSHRSDIPNYHAPSEWVEMIAAAGLAEYAALGRRMLDEGRVRIVAPPSLDANYNAFAWLDSNEIWINEPMFERYPDVLDQATIFLHELIHIKSTEQTHLGPWWSAQSEFRARYVAQSTAAALKPTDAHADEASVVTPKLLGSSTGAALSSGGA